MYESRLLSGNICHLVGRRKEQHGWMPRNSVFHGYPRWKSLNTETRTAFSQLCIFGELYMITELRNWSINSQAVHSKGLRISPSRRCAAFCIATRPSLPGAVNSSLIICVFFCFSLPFSLPLAFAKFASSVESFVEPPPCSYAASSHLKPCIRVTGWATEERRTAFSALRVFYPFLRHCLVQRACPISQGKTCQG